MKSGIGSPEYFFFTHQPANQTHRFSPEGQQLYLPANRKQKRTLKYVKRLLDLLVSHPCFWQSQCQSTAQEREVEFCGGYVIHNEI